MIQVPARLQIYAAWWLACVLWSSTYVFIRIGVAEVSPWTFASARLALALAVLIPLTLARNGFRAVTSRDAAHIMGAASCFSA